MPSHRKRIGFLPSEEVHDIIDKLCKANEFSQSKITGLLVEEALRSRGILTDSFSQNTNGAHNFITDSLAQELLTKDNKSQSINDVFRINKKLFSEDLKMIHEFIEFKYFKNVMKQNKNIFE